MDQNEKRQLENTLMTNGLAGLNPDGSPTGELVQQLAELVNRWPGDRHEFIMGLINDCDPDKRVAMYESIRPHLKFRALELGEYEARIAQRASELVSKGVMRVEGEAPQPVTVGSDPVLDPFRVAGFAIATLYCYRCFKKKRYKADTPVSAMIMARKGGWVREPGVNKEICAKCAAKLAAHEVAVLSRDTVMVITDKRRVN